MPNFTKKKILHFQYLFYQLKLCISKVCLLNCLYQKERSIDTLKCKLLIVGHSLNHDRKVDSFSGYFLWLQSLNHSLKYI